MQHARPPFLFHPGSSPPGQLHITGTVCYLPITNHNSLSGIWNLESGITFLNGIRSALLAWYDAEARDLPWRVRPGSRKILHPNPYSVLVSEIMLQQTTVQAVIPYFNRWMERYPTIQDLAEAPEEEVLRSWEGLGYYSRARNLHQAAREMVTRYGGKLPEDVGKLRGLPGIGDYTSGAVASIAYGKREPALDANITRVLSRLFAIRKDPEKVHLKTDPATRRYLCRLAYRLVPQDRPGDFNQALMDLGSLICRPKDPLCSRCPLDQWCRALDLSLTDLIPERAKQAFIQSLEAALGIIHREDRILVQRRPPEGLFAGMWEFPGGKLRVDPPTPDGFGAASERAHGRGGAKAETETQRHADAVTRESGGGEIESPEEAVVREVREETGLRIQVCEKLGIFSHSYTRFRVKLHVFLCKRKAGRLTNTEAKWVTLEELETLPMPSANRRIVRALEERLETGKR